MLLLKYGITRKKQVNKLLKPESELNIDKDKEYKVQPLKNSIVYTSKAIER